MPKNLKTPVFVILTSLLLVAGVKPAMAAGSASLTLSGGTFNVGQTFSTSIYEDSGGTGVNVVEADLTYDPSQLEFVSIDTSGSAFPGTVTGSGGSGSVKIIRYAVPPNTGNKLVAIVNFKGPAKAGTTAVYFASSSHVISSGTDIWDKNANGATYQFVEPQPAAPPVAAPVVKKPTPPPPPVAKKEESAKLKKNNRTLPKFTFASPQNKTPDQSWMIYAWAGVSVLLAGGFTAYHYHRVRIHKRLKRLSKYVNIPISTLTSLK